MENYLKEIEKKIQGEIEIEEIKIIDNSQKHKKHKFFDRDKYHLKLEIKSKILKSKPQIESQRLIMNILKDDLKTKIHALEISIEQ